MRQQNLIGGEGSVGWDAQGSRRKDILPQIVVHGRTSWRAYENTDSWAPTPPSASGVGLRICISSKWPGGADAAGEGVPFGEPGMPSWLDGDFLKGYYFFSKMTHNKGRKGT